MGAVEIKLLLILGILVAVIGFLVWIKKSGEDKAMRKVLQNEKQARKIFEDRGEDWDAAADKRRIAELKRLSKLRNRKVRTR